MDTKSLFAALKAVQCVNSAASKAKDNAVVFTGGSLLASSAQSIFIEATQMPEDLNCQIHLAPLMTVLDGVPSLESIEGTSMGGNNGTHATIRFSPKKKVRLPIQPVELYPIDTRALNGYKKAMEVAVSSGTALIIPFTILSSLLIETMRNMEAPQESEPFTSTVVLWITNGHILAGAGSALRLVKSSGLAIESTFDDQIKLPRLIFTVLYQLLGMTDELSAFQLYIDDPHNPRLAVAKFATMSIYFTINTTELQSEVMIQYFGHLLTKYDEWAELEWFPVPETLREELLKMSALHPKMIEMQIENGQLRVSLPKDAAIDYYVNFDVPTQVSVPAFCLYPKVLASGLGQLSYFLPLFRDSGELDTLLVSNGITDGEAAFVIMFSVAPVSSGIKPVSSSEDADDEVPFDIEIDDTIPEDDI